MLRKLGGGGTRGKGKKRKKEGGKKSPREVQKRGKLKAATGRRGIKRGKKAQQKGGNPEGDNRKNKT